MFHWLTIVDQIFSLWLQLNHTFFKPILVQNCKMLFKKPHSHIIFIQAANGPVKTETYFCKSWVKLRDTISYISDGVWYLKCSLRYISFCRHNKIMFYTLSTCLIDDVSTYPGNALPLVNILSDYPKCVYIEKKMSANFKPHKSAQRVNRCEFY